MPPLSSNNNFCGIFLLKISHKDYCLEFLYASKQILHFYSPHPLFLFLYFYVYTIDFNLQHSRISDAKKKADINLFVLTLFASVAATIHAVAHASQTRCTHRSRRGYQSPGRRSRCSSSKPCSGGCTVTHAGQMGRRCGAGRRMVPRPGLPSVQDAELVVHELGSWDRELSRVLDLLLLLLSGQIPKHPVDRGHL